MSVDQVAVGGLTYDIVPDNLIGRERDCFAELRPGRLQIAFDPDVADRRQGLSLVHEVVEAASGRYDLGLPHAAVCALAEALHDFLVANPDAVRHIVNGYRIVKDR